MSRHWREAGASDQREQGNAADTHAISLIERELPSATYIKSERFHPSVSVRSSLPRSRAWAGTEELSDLPGSGTPSTVFW